MKKKRSWVFLYHHLKSDKWSLPKGFSETLSNKGLKIFDFIFENDYELKLPDKAFIEENNIEVLLIFYAGYSEKLNYELIKFRYKFPKVIIINELGDEPQTKCFNYIRASLSDICLSPDFESQQYWKKKGFNCKWFTHWADSKIFYLQNHGKREFFLSTTMGKRKYNFFLKMILGNLYKNKSLEGFENNLFYNNSQNAFQYARWDEITRRIFEASACGCCVLTNNISKKKNLENIFNHNESIIFYKNRFSLLIEILKLFKNRNKSRRIGKTAAYIVEKYHTDKIRANQLVEYVNEFKDKSKNFL